MFRRDPIRKAEKALAKASRLAFPKCKQGRHIWETIKTIGLGRHRLERCKRCGWFMTRGTNIDGEPYSQMAKPNVHWSDYLYYLKVTRK